MKNNIEGEKEKKKINRLTLTRVSEGLKVGTKKDGKKYTVRDDRSAYFFPERWLKFFETIKEEKKPIFDFLINTGARIEEALNVTPDDFDWERNNLTLRVTKTKASKGESVGRKRTFSISSQFKFRMRKYINKVGLGVQYEDFKTGKISFMSKGESPYLFPISKQAVSQMFKRGLKRAEFADWQQFSLHNIRKTHGNWLKALEIPSDEICLRLGHDHNTYLRHYGSASIFDRKDKMLMIKILGDVYGLK